MDVGSIDTQPDRPADNAGDDPSSAEPDRSDDSGANRTAGDACSARSSPSYAGTNSTIPSSRVDPTPDQRSGDAASDDACHDVTFADAHQTGRYVIGIAVFSRADLP